MSKSAVLFFDIYPTPFPLSPPPSPLFLFLRPDLPIRIWNNKKKGIKDRRRGGGDSRLGGGAEPDLTRILWGNEWPRRLEWVHPKTGLIWALPPPLSLAMHHLIVVEKRIYVFFLSSHSPPKMKGHRHTHTAFSREKKTLLLSPSPLPSFSIYSFFLGIVRNSSCRCCCLPFLFISSFPLFFFFCHCIFFCHCGQSKKREREEDAQR